MEKETKDFLVSTADVAFLVDGVLAFTGTTSINTSIAVSMEDQEITGGKGNKTLYKYKYGRKLSPTIEMAEWNLAYIAANVGTPIFEGLRNVFSVGECVALTNGVGTLSKVPAGKVFIELEDGSISEVTPVGSAITLGSENATIRATYQYNTSVRRITVDTSSTPLVGELILTADKHNSAKGKVGEVQIVVPAFQLSGNFDISLEASGTTTTTLEGDALAVGGASCMGNSVYAYITEIPSAASSISVREIAATPAVVDLAVGDTKKLSIIGIKGGLYSNVEIDAAECTITSDDSSVASVSDGIITGISAGTTCINIVYNEITDVVKVLVS